MLTPRSIAEQRDGRLFPIRCFTCGKVIGDKWSEYSRRVLVGESPRKVLDDMGINRYCCRRIFLSHIDLAPEYLRFSPYRHRER